MKEQNHKSNQQNSNPRNKALDSLLKDKYDNERLEEWKKLMPIPDGNPKRNTTRPILLLLALGLTLGVVWWISNNQSSDPMQLADNFIHETRVASFSDMSARGKKSNIANASSIRFHKAIELLKSEKENEAIKLLGPLAEESNRYQLEACLLYTSPSPRDS